MKKLLAMLLALTLVLSMGVAMAEDETGGGEGAGEPTPPVEITSFTMNKEYQLMNDGTSNPAETFTFDFECFDVLYGSTGTVKNAPTISATVSFDDGEITHNPSKHKPFNVSVKDCQWPGVGLYKYHVTEVAGKSAGVTYASNIIDLWLYVANGAEGGYVVKAYTFHENESGEDKKLGNLNMHFTNQYDAGDLSIRKLVTGPMADPDQTFTVKVVLTAPQGVTMRDSYALTYYNGMNQIIKVENISFDEQGNVTKELSIKANETYIFANLPKGVTYEVEEINIPAGYNQKSIEFTNTSQTISNTDDTVTVTNESITIPDTGISLDDLPYIILLAVAVLGIAALLLKKRFAANHD